MNIFRLKDLYERNNLPEAETKSAIDLVMEVNEQIDLDLDAIDTDVLDQLIRYLVKENKNTVPSFVVLMRYFNVIDRKDLFIHLTKYTGMLGVMDNIEKRLIGLKGKAEAERILSGFQKPILGTPPVRLPDYVNQLMVILDSNLEASETEDVLAGNNHGVSKESQLPEKVEYEKSASLKDYLRERHQRKVEELTKHFQENKVWFEQVITKEVVDFVASNQEVLSGVLENDKLYITKIPYDTLAYLNAENETDKKYYGCHCPFAREAIKAGRTDISGRFCYCSAGFAKFPFETILDQKLKIKVLDSILMGGDLCRFEIDLENVSYKK
ncbi:MAG: hypothetical protein JXB08_02615 [Bacilli bacterium]|nr:hypothetical protein [Bacilli bacterium]MBN2876889.1 hypothetical protein [Bacilli bacterium]